MLAVLLSAACSVGPLAFRSGFALRRSALSLIFFRLWASGIQFHAMGFGLLPVGARLYGTPHRHGPFAYRSARVLAFFPALSPRLPFLTSYSLPFPAFSLAALPQQGYWFSGPGSWVTGFPALGLSMFSHIFSFVFPHIFPLLFFSQATGLQALRGYCFQAPLNSHVCVCVRRVAHYCLFSTFLDSAVFIH